MESLLVTVYGRFEAMSAAGGLTPFVGSEEELRSLLSRWERVLEGEGQVALISGEAGIGKSRLLWRFHEQIAGTPHTWIEAGAGTFFQNTPFYPISEILRQFVTDSADQDPVAQLASRLTAVGLNPVEAVPLIAPLLNLPLPAEYPPSPLSPEQQRRRLLATLVEWVLGAAKAQPLVLSDRGFALGRSLDTGIDPVVGRAGRDRATAPHVHGAPRVPGAVGAAHASHAAHAEPAERT